MIDQIKEKLQNQLLSELSFNQEKDVVYFCVEMRKLLERENLLTEYKTISFYCDWCLHPVLNRNGSVKRIEEILELMDSGNGYKGMQMMISLSGLKSEISQVCRRFELEDFTHHSSDWMNFIANLKEVLLEQPIEINPSLGYSVKSIRFIDDTGEGKKYRFSLSVEYWQSSNGRQRSVTYNKEFDI